MILPPRKTGQRWIIETSSERNAKIVIEYLSNGKCRVLQVIRKDSLYDEYVVGADISFGFNSDSWKYELLEGQEKPT